jgi:hypothetical protein
MKIKNVICCIYDTYLFFFFTSVLGCGEESASYQRDEEIHKQKYFLFVGFIEQFKWSDTCQPIVNDESINSVLHR